MLSMFTDDIFSVENIESKLMRNSVTKQQLLNSSRKKYPKLSFRTEETINANSNRTNWEVWKSFAKILFNQKLQQNKFIFFLWNLLFLHLLVFCSKWFSFTNAGLIAFTLKTLLYRNQIIFILKKEKHFLRVRCTNSSFLKFFNVLYQQKIFVGYYNLYEQVMYNMEIKCSTCGQQTPQN